MSPSARDPVDRAAHDIVVQPSAPSILIMMTLFTRIVVVLSILSLWRSKPPPHRRTGVILALAMFLTAFVMGPVLQKSYDDGIRPLVANQIGVEDALQRASVPLRGFMQENVREKDLKLFVDLSGEPPPATPEQMSLRILVPAFMISELDVRQDKTNYINDLGAICFPVLAPGQRLGSVEMPQGNCARNVRSYVVSCR